MATAKQRAEKKRLARKEATATAKEAAAAAVAASSVVTVRADSNARPAMVPVDLNTLTSAELLNYVLQHQGQKSLEPAPATPDTITVSATIPTPVLTVPTASEPPPGFSDTPAEVPPAITWNETSDPISPATSVPTSVNTLGSSSTFIPSSPLAPASFSMADYRKRKERDCSPAEPLPRKKAKALSMAPPLSSTSLVSSTARLATCAVSTVHPSSSISQQQNAVLGQAEGGGAQSSRSIKDLARLEQDIVNSFKEKLENYVWFTYAFPLPTIVDAFWSEAAANKGYPELKISSSGHKVVCISNIIPC
jgi:hypothetical protein